MSKKPRTGLNALGNPGAPKNRDRTRRLREEEGLSPLIAEVCAGIDEFLEAARAGESLEGLATIRVRKLEPSSGRRSKTRPRRPRF